MGTVYLTDRVEEYLERLAEQRMKTKGTTYNISDVLSEMFFGDENGKKV